MLERPTLQNRWIIVGASAFALIAGGSPMLVFTFGVLLKPITEDTGWTRAEVSGALSLMLCATALMSPVIGVLVDRFGVRRPLIASILATACVFALISASPNLWLFWAGFLLLGMVSQGLQPIIYSKVVVAWFDDWRGIALGIVNAGQGIGAMLLPPITGILLASFGWRGAYLGLALLLLIVTLPGAIAIIRENPARLTDRRGPVASDAGISLRALTRSRPFWLIVLSAFVLSLAINGTVPHMVALLTDRDYSTGAAVGAMSVLGLAGMAGASGPVFWSTCFSRRSWRGSSSRSRRAEWRSSGWTCPPCRRWPASF